MKKHMFTFVLSALLLVGMTACSLVSPTYNSTLPTTSDNSKTGLTGSDTTDDGQSANNDNDIASREKVYTIEQIQVALQPQFEMGDWGEGNPQVISAEKVTRDIDSIILDDSAGDTIDLSKSTRYKVEVKYKQSAENYNTWVEIYKDTEINPFRRDGDFTILTDDYYFNDLNGNPELAFIKD